MYIKGVGRFSPYAATCQTLDRYRLITELECKKNIGLTPNKKSAKNTLLATQKLMTRLKNATNKISNVFFDFTI